MRSGPYCITDSRTYSSCGTTLSWPTPFADANYSVTCTGIGATDSRANITIAARLAHGVVVNVVTYGPVAVSFSEVDCGAGRKGLQKRKLEEVCRRQNLQRNQSSPAACWSTISGPVLRFRWDRG